MFSQQQFVRWRDFALRMARTCYARSRRPTCGWIAMVVEQYFDSIRDQPWVPHIRDWCNTDGHDGPWTDLPCDSLAVYLHDWMQYEIDEEPVETLQQRESSAKEQWCGQWGGPVVCCVRAGLDVATGADAGVLGFTAGDLRRMYPEGVRGWVMPRHERLQDYNLMTGETSEDGLFDELADDAPLLL